MMEGILRYLRSPPENTGRELKVEIKEGDILNALESLKAEPILRELGTLEFNVNKIRAYFSRINKMIVEYYTDFLKRNPDRFTRFSIAVDKLKEENDRKKKSTVLGQYMLLREVRHAYDEMMKKFPEIDPWLPRPPPISDLTMTAEKNIFLASSEKQPARLLYGKFREKS